MKEFKLNSMTYKVLATKIEGHACVLSSATTDKTVTVVTAHLLSMVSKMSGPVDIYF